MGTECADTIYGLHDSATGNALPLMTVLAVLDNLYWHLSYDHRTIWVSDVAWLGGTAVPTILWHMSDKCDDIV